MMGLKKSSVFIILLLVSLNLALAEGCFTYKSSALYCYDLDQEDAVEECSTYSSCNIKESFYDSQTCENSVLFPECEEIYCKSTCDYQYKGNCLGGQVPSGQEYDWCSAGCCQFSYSNSNYCNYQKSKWLCQVAAKNKAQTIFSFDSKSTATQCTATCNKNSVVSSTTSSQSNLSTTSLTTQPPTTTSPQTTKLNPTIKNTSTSMTTNLVISNKTTTKPTQSGSAVQTNTSIKTTLTKTTSTNLSTDSTSSTWLWFVFILTIVFIVFYLAYQRNKSIKPTLSQTQTKIKQRPFFALPSSLPPIKSHITKHHHHHHELFDIFGETKPHKKTYVDLLEKVAKIHELKKAHWKKNQKERDFFQEVEKNIIHLKSEEIKKLTELEAQVIFERLKSIVEKK